MKKERRLEILIVLCLSALILIPRLVGLDAFVSVDEPDWLKFGANFFHALGTGDFGSTVYDYHPGVTTMWVVTAGFLWGFRAYRAIALEYFWKGPQFDAFLNDNGHPPLDLVWRARVVEVLVICVLLLLVYACLRQLVGRRTAVVAVSLTSIEPFFLGHSRLLNHEGMLSLFSVLCMLTLLIWVYRSGGTRYLVFSAIFAALAQLTKSSAIILFPLAGLILLVKFISDWKNGLEARKALFWHLARSFLLWLGVIALVYVILWPGMWAKPGEMLYKVYGNAFSYALQGGRLEVTQDLEVSRFGLETGGFPQYLAGMLWRTTPVEWLGLLLAIWMLFSRKAEAKTRTTGAYLLILGALYILMFSIARGRDAAHYIMTSYICLDLMAALGFIFSLERLAAWKTTFQRPMVKLATLVLILAIQGASGLPQYPYYYTYSNPLMLVLFPGQNPNYGYAEVLDQAAHYLAAKPKASELTVTAWYGRSLAYLFPGQVSVFKPMYSLTQDALDNLRSTDYFVVYYAQQKKRNIPTGFIKIMEPAVPEKVIWFNGIEYVRIYKVSDLPEVVIKALGQ
jgi:4-amino-4-deoxy-L-arabinose transferase-like glycosyltransferase